MLTLGEAVDHVRRRIEEDGFARAAICYEASEALYLLAGGKSAGLTPMRVKIRPDDAQSHWFIRGPHGEIIDLTAGQFERPPDYSGAIGTGFFPRTATLTKELMRGAA